MTKLVTTNTIPQHEHLEACNRLVCVDIAQVLAETIRRSHYGIPWSGSAAIDYTTQSSPDESNKSAKPTRPSSPDQAQSPQANILLDLASQAPLSALPS
ncbi:hypothetical protein PGTUg99_025880 [Puccinia graminis f. sp. tritici]|uniref:Uncharacterized protein n=1 Tax=Puccinia graminis f. sp. tritici TaxID=56615 RepID=A0A5B0RYZ9_PUCGR|nr:hypothetical protein PGTUg99_025880 [Puccinia graminis f. sp. tritici]